MNAAVVVLDKSEGLKRFRNYSCSTRSGSWGAQLSPSGLIPLEMHKWYNRYAIS